MGFLSKLKHHAKKLVGKVAKKHVEEVAEEVKKVKKTAKKVKGLVKKTKTKTKGKKWKHLKNLIKT